MNIQNTNMEDIKIDRVLGHLPENAACRSAIVLRNSLVAVQYYQGPLLNYESSSIALFNYKTNRIVKTVKVPFSRPPSNIQQHTLQTDEEGKVLIVSDDFGIVIFSIERAFKILSKYNIPNTAMNLPVPNLGLMQPLTKVKLLNSQELLIARGSSLLKWNFYTQKAPSQIPELVAFPFLQKIADFSCDSERNLLTIMLEDLTTSQACMILILDLTDLTVLSSAKFDCKLLNRFWTVDMESGSISVIQTSLLNKESKSQISFLRVNEDFKIQLWRSYEIDGFPLPVLNSSSKYSCISISQMVGQLVRRCWGYFDYAEDRIYTATYSFSEGTEDTIPRGHKLLESFDNLGVFIGSHKGRIFLTHQSRVIKQDSAFSSKKFWMNARDSWRNNLLARDDNILNSFEFKKY